MIEVKEAPKSMLRAKYYLWLAKRQHRNGHLSNAGGNYLSAAVWSQSGSTYEEARQGMEDVTNLVQPNGVVVPAGPATLKVQPLPEDVDVHAFHLQAQDVATQRGPQIIEAQQGFYTVDRKGRIQWIGEIRRELVPRESYQQPDFNPHQNLGAMEFL